MNDNTNIEILTNWIEICWLDRIIGFILCQLLGGATLFNIYKKHINNRDRKTWGWEVITTYEWIRHRVGDYYNKWMNKRHGVDLLQQMNWFS
mgnify:CR=1 FL=1